MTDFRTTNSHLKISSGGIDAQIQHYELKKADEDNYFIVVAT